LGDETLDRCPERSRVESAVELVAELHTRAAAHPLLPEVRHHSKDLGLSFFVSNLADAIRGLEALPRAAFQPSAKTMALRDRLLDRLYPALTDAPRRAQVLKEAGGPDTLLHGGQYSMNKITNHKRVLVTGGAGFLGSHFCDRLVADGCDVLCADNFFSGTKDNIAHLIGNPRFELLRHDVTFPLYVEVDEIYNLACPASPIHYQYDPVQTTKTSVHGAINMLGLAKRTKAKILQASTSEVYGDPTVHPQTEAYWGHVNPIGLRSCYDEGKRCAETLFFDYRRQHKLRIKVARIFNTYG